MVIHCPRQRQGLRRQERPKCGYFIHRHRQRDKTIRSHLFINLRGTMCEIVACWVELAARGLYAASRAPHTALKDPKEELPETLQQ